MRLMTWDASLATLATGYAARCLFAHNKNRRNERYHPVGENIYISSGAPYNVAYGRNAVEAWDGERVYYNYQTKTCTPNKMCGHYTQVVWADTFKVGCGVASCPTVNVRGRVWNDATILICNYGPGGNYINSFPYESGRSCTNCHSSDTCNNKLCTNTGRDSLVVPAASWMSWTSWSACSTTCGYGGTRRRSRECNTFVSKDCGSPAKEFEFFCASTQCGSTTSTSTSGANWRAWTSWTACSATCGGGRRERTRSCSSGRLQDCTGYNQQFLDCNRRPCPSWNNWRGWGSCSVTCGGGRKVRTRACNTGSNADCSGLPQASQPCNTNACPTGWSTWSSWSRCSTTCGGGIRTRNRGCQALSSSQCPGPRRERGPCNTQSCSAASGWSSWSAWSACSHTCGPSTSSSTRSCPSSATCTGRRRKTKNCRMPACTTSSWANWGVWSECSQTCGGGTRSKRRSCNIGNTGPGCSGQNVTRESCSTSSCPGWSSWSAWSACSHTCGPSTSSSTRSCPSSATCTGRRRKTKNCRMPACTTSSWANWGVWSECSQTCGGGTRSKRRSCNIGNTGPGCSGQNVARESCSTSSCPVFLNWGSWTSCSVTCGRGTNERRRLCSTGSATDCSGSASHTRPCFITACTLSGWRSWGLWGECSKTCGGGSRTRSRICDRGNSGPTCAGGATSMERCNNQACPRFGGWTTWNACPVTCGRGERSRIRICNTGTNSDCSGSATDTKQCVMQQCTVSAWSPWSAWSACTRTCGGGKRDRRRICNVGDSNEDCRGVRTQQEGCQPQTCPVYNEWTQWSICSTTCGSGFISRSRQCSSEAANACTGPSTDSRQCTATTAKCTSALDDPRSRSDDVTTSNPNAGTAPNHNSLFIVVMFLIACIIEMKVLH